MAQRRTKHLVGPLSPVVGSPISVDDFSTGDSRSGGVVRVYLLTHAHEDHLAGLHSKWRLGPIYCTEVTKRLVLLRFPDLDPGLFRVVHVGETTRVQLQHSSSSLLSITPLDAKHCAGSCMFLLESPSLFGASSSVLHTGDFRFEDKTDYPDELLPQSSSSSSSSNNGHTRWIYLDNTFGLANSPSFPPRREVASVLAQALQLYAADTVFVFNVKGLGKEELLECAARALSSKVCLTSERFAKVWRFSSEETGEEAEGEKGVFTVHGALHGCRVYCLPAAPSLDGRVVQVDVTGWGGMQAWTDLQRVLAEGTDRPLPSRLRVPYSLHCCLRELDQFLAHCSSSSSTSTRVVPTVNCSVEQRDWLVGGAAGSAVFPLLSAPQEHARRQDLKRTRIVAASGEENDQEEDVLVLFRQGGVVGDDGVWTLQEDQVLLAMWHKRHKCGEHHALRRGLARRTDLEIITRTRLLLLKDPPI